MTSGFSLEIVGLSRLVGGFHDVRACSGVFIVMRWMVLEKVLEVATLWGRLCFTAKSPWQLMRTCWLVPTLTWSPWLFR
jgi:hypothetical protein